MDRPTRLYVALIAVVTFSVGCKDKAAPYYETCASLADKGELSHAADACENALKADPESTAGKAAKTRLVEWQAAALKKCNNLVAVGQLEAARTECNGAYASFPDADPVVSKKAMETLQALAPAIQKQQAEKLEASCTGGKWLTICDIGPNGSGQQLFATHADCQKTVDEQRELTHVSCDPCRCVHY